MRVMLAGPATLGASEHTERLCNNEIAVFLDFKNRFVCLQRQKRTQIVSHPILGGALSETIYYNSHPFRHGQGKP